MANLIVTKKQNKSIPLNHAVKPSDFDFTASNDISRTVTEIRTQVLTELERTPGAVAVSGMAGRGGRVEASPAFPKTNSKGCGGWSVLSECSSGEHHFAKRIVCGKEYCPECGQDDSPAHKRRQSRLVPKLQQVKELGYFVIEFPEIYRHIGQRGIDPDPEIAAWCYSKRDLIDTTNRIVEVMAGKRMGRRGRVGGYFNRGLIRWHFYGDKIEGKWNPHANVLVDGGFLAPELLEKIKADLRAALNCPDLIVNYSFTDQPAQIMHKLRYVTRATFRNYDWNPYMATELFNFRNQRWWGSWKDGPAWELKEAEAGGADIEGLAMVNNLQNGICPDCGQPLKTLYHSHKTGQPVQWTKPVDSIYLMLWNAEEIAGSGYYRIPHHEWTGTSFSPDKVVEYTRRDQFVALLAYAKETRRQRRQDFNESWWDSLLQEHDQYGGWPVTE